MVYVVLRTGRVLEYNAAGYVAVFSNFFELSESRQAEGFIAKIPLDVVERIEWERPCRTYKQRPLRKVRATY